MITQDLINEIQEALDKIERLSSNTQEFQNARNTLFIKLLNLLSLTSQFPQINPKESIPDIFPEIKKIIQKIEILLSAKKEQAHEKPFNILNSLNLLLKADYKMILWFHTEQDKYPLLQTLRELKTNLSEIQKQNTSGVFKKVLGRNKTINFPEPFLPQFCEDRIKRIIDNEYSLLQAHLSNPSAGGYRPHESLAQQIQNNTNKYLEHHDKISKEIQETITNGFYTEAEKKIKEWNTKENLPKPVGNDLFGEEDPIFPKQTDFFKTQHENIVQEKQDLEQKIKLAQQEKKTVQCFTEKFAEQTQYSQAETFAKELERSENRLKALTLQLRNTAENIQKINTNDNNTATNQLKKEAENLEYQLQMLLSLPNHSILSDQQQRLLNGIQQASEINKNTIEELEKTTKKREEELAQSLQTLRSLKENLKAINLEQSSPPPNSLKTQYDKAVELKTESFALVEEKIETQNSLLTNLKELKGRFTNSCVELKAQLINQAERLLAETTEQERLREQRLAEAFEAKIQDEEQKIMESHDTYEQPKINYKNDIYSNLTFHKQSADWLLLQSTNIIKRDLELVNTPILETLFNETQDQQANTNSEAFQHLVITLITKLYQEALAELDMETQNQNKLILLQQVLEKIKTIADKAVGLLPNADWAHVTNNEGETIGLILDSLGSEAFTLAANTKETEISTKDLQEKVFAPLFAVAKICKAGRKEQQEYLKQVAEKIAAIEAAERNEDGTLKDPDAQCKVDYDFFHQCLPYNLTSLMNLVETIKIINTYLTAQEILSIPECLIKKAQNPTATTFTQQEQKDIRKFVTDFQETVLSKINLTIDQKIEKLKKFSKTTQSSSKETQKTITTKENQEYSYKLSEYFSNNSNKPPENYPLLTHNKKGVLFFDSLQTDNQGLAFFILGTLVCNDVQQNQTIIIKNTNTSDQGKILVQEYTAQDFVTKVLSEFGFSSSTTDSEQLWLEQKQRLKEMLSLFYDRSFSGLNLNDLDAPKHHFNPVAKRVSLHDSLKKQITIIKKPSPLVRNYANILAFKEQTLVPKLQAIEKAETKSATEENLPKILETLRSNNGLSLSKPQKLDIAIQQGTLQNGVDYRRLDKFLLSKNAAGKVQVVQRMGGNSTHYPRDELDKTTPLPSSILLPEGQPPGNQLDNVQGFSLSGESLTITVTDPNRLTDKAETASTISNSSTLSTASTASNLPTPGSEKTKSSRPLVPPLKLHQKHKSDSGSLSDRGNHSTTQQDRAKGGGGGSQTERKPTASSKMIEGTSTPMVRSGSFSPNIPSVTPRAAPSATTPREPARPTPRTPAAPKAYEINPPTLQSWAPPEAQPSGEVPNISTPGALQNALFKAITARNHGALQDILKAHRAQPTEVSEPTQEALKEALFLAATIKNQEAYTMLKESNPDYEKKHYSQQALELWQKKFQDNFSFGSGMTILQALFYDNPEIIETKNDAVVKLFWEKEQWELLKIMVAGENQSVWQCVKRSIIEQQKNNSDDEKIKFITQMLHAQHPNNLVSLIFEAHKDSQEKPEKLEKKIKDLSRFLSNILGTQAPPEKHRLAKIILLASWPNNQNPKELENLLGLTLTDPEKATITAITQTANTKSGGITPEGAIFDKLLTVENIERFDESLIDIRLDLWEQDPRPELENPNPTITFGCDHVQKLFSATHRDHNNSLLQALEQKRELYKKIHQRFALAKEATLRADLSAISPRPEPPNTARNGQTLAAELAALQPNHCKTQLDLAKKIKEQLSTIQQQETASDNTEHLLKKIITLLNDLPHALQSLKDKTKD